MEVRGFLNWTSPQLAHTDTSQSPLLWACALRTKLLFQSPSPLGLKDPSEGPSSHACPSPEVPARPRPRGKTAVFQPAPSTPEAAPLHGSDASRLPCGQRLQTHKQQLNNNNNKTPTKPDNVFINDHHALGLAILLQTTYRSGGGVVSLKGDSWADARGPHQNLVSGLEAVEGQGRRRGTSQPQPFLPVIQSHPARPEGWLPGGRAAQTVANPRTTMGQL